MNQNTSSTKPLKRPFRWTKRALIALAGFLLLATALRIGWGMHASRQYAAAVARGKEIHPAWTWQDFIPPPEINNSPAFGLYMQARGKMDDTLQEPEDQRERTRQSEQPLELWELVQDARGANEHATLRQRTLRICTPALELVDQASRHWPGGLQLAADEPWPNVDLPALREVSTLVALAAVDAAKAGKFAEAMKRTEQLRHMARTATTWPMVLSFLVAESLEQRRLEVLQRMAGRLQIGLEAGHARPEQIRALIAELAEEQTLRSDLVLAMASDRAWALHLTVGLAAGKRKELGHGSWQTELLLGPLLDLDLALLLKTHDGYILAAKAESLPAARATFGPYHRMLPDEEDSILARAAHPITRIMLPDYDRVFVRRFQTGAKRRLAALWLAMRLWDYEHPGQPLPELAALAEAYSIPLEDPTTGGKLHLLVEGDLRVLASSRYQSVRQIQQARQSEGYDIAVFWLNAEDIPAEDED